MQKRWHIAEPIADSFASRFPEIPPIVLQILVNRGVLRETMTEDDALHALDVFLNPDYGRDVHDPFLFRDMRKAVDRIRVAIEGQQKMYVYGDYDADGVSGAVILATTIRRLGGIVDVYIPHRETEGYGVNQKAVEYIAESGARLILTCDCGISNRDEVIRANELGVDVIITDHHTIPPELPPAYAIIHPLIPGETYPFKGLAGGGVAFKVAMALLRDHALFPEATFDRSAFEKWLLDMVVVSTVGDMMPILGENRALTKYGLIVLNRTARIGLRALIEGAGLTKNGRALDTMSVGWAIAPRINAAGRMQHANVAYRLCTTEDPAEAERLAIELNATNRERQERVATMLDEAKSLIPDVTARVIVVVGNGWPLGLVGLVAGKLVEAFSRPAIVITNRDGELAGSCRSIAGFDMIAAMRSFPQFFRKFGGHPASCGFTMRDPNAVPALRDAFCKRAEAVLASELLQPTLRIDGILMLTDIQWKLWEYLERLEPFGDGNPRPRAVAYGVTVTQMSAVGADGKHLRCTVRAGDSTLQCIGFGLVESVPQLQVGDTVDIVFEIDVNEWNGNRSLQLKLIDLQKRSNT